MPVNQSPPELSVITICYRNPVGLRATLESLRLLAAGGRIALEQIIVDSSPEAHEPILRDWKPPWAVQRLEVRPEGIYAAMNTGAAKATGKALWFLHAGDRLKHSDVLLAALQKIPQASLVICGADLFHGGRFSYSVSAPLSLKAGTLGKNRICQQAVLYEAQAFRKLGGFSTKWKILADYEFHLRSYFSGQNALPVAGSLVNYDMGGVSASSISLVASEYGQIQHLHRSSFSVGERIYNKTSVGLDLVRLRIVKWLSASWLSPVLRPIWIFLKRARSKVGSGPR